MVVNYRCKKFYNIGPRWHPMSTLQLVFLLEICGRFYYIKLDCLKISQSVMKRLFKNCLTLIRNTGNNKGGSTTVLLTSCLTGLELVVCHWQFFYLQNRLIQTSQTGVQWYSDTSPYSIPCGIFLAHKNAMTGSK